MKDNLVNKSGDLVKDLVNDCISRQDAIALLEEAESAWLRGDILLFYPVMLKGLKKLPSAESELLTDKEQRIFLAAMARERKVCEDTDKQFTREAYEKNLVEICDEIERKVRNALWTE